MNTPQRQQTPKQADVSIQQIQQKDISFSDKQEKPNDSNIISIKESSDLKKVLFPEIINPKKQSENVDVAQKKRSLTSPKSPPLLQAYDTFLNRELEDNSQEEKNKGIDNQKIVLFLSKLKKDRKESDEELLVLENRVKLLRKEDEKTQKKIEEIRKKSDELAFTKQRHAQDLQKKEEAIREEQEKIASILEQRESKRQKSKEKRSQKIAEQQMRNHEQYIEMKRDQDKQRQVIQLAALNHMQKNAKLASKMRKKHSSSLLKIRENKVIMGKLLERFHGDIQTEAQKQLENEQRIIKLEMDEQHLLKKLQKSQLIQQKSFLHLQDIINAEPSQISVYKRSNENKQVESSNKQYSNLRVMSPIQEKRRRIVSVCKTSATEQSDFTDQSLSTNISLPLSQKIQLKALSPISNNSEKIQNLRQDKQFSANQAYEHVEQKELQNIFNKEQINESIHFDSSTPKQNQLAFPTINAYAISQSGSQQFGRLSGDNQQQNKNADSQISQRQRVSFQENYQQLSKSKEINSRNNQEMLSKSVNDIVIESQERNNSALKFEDNDKLAEKKRSISYDDISTNNENQKSRKNKDSPSIKELLEEINLKNKGNKQSKARKRKRVQTTDIHEESRISQVLAPQKPKINLGAKELQILLLYNNFPTKKQLPYKMKSPKGYFYSKQE